MCASCPIELAHDLDGAFGRFVAHHQDLVYGIAARRVGRPDADDVAQETFLRAWKALRGYPTERVLTLQARGWLARIAINLVRDRARDAAPPADPLDAADGPGHDPAAPAREGPESVVGRREAARRWAGLLAGLPDRYRMAVELRHVEGLSYAELSAALGRPVNTVKSDVHRGVLMLRDAHERDLERWRALGARPAEVAR